MITRSEYLESVFSPQRYNTTMKRVAKALSQLRFGAIAFRGTSGAAIAFPMGFVYNKPLIHIRKPGGHHSYSLYEGAMGIKTYVIVDDFISSGSTVKTIVDEIKSEHKFNERKVPKCVGAIFYSAYEENNSRYVETMGKLFGYKVPVFCLGGK